VPRRSVTANARTVLERAVQRASVTRAVIVDPNALARLPKMLATLGAMRAVRVVGDPDTMQAAGQRALAILRSAGITTEEPIVLHDVPRLKPRVDTARDVAAQLAKTRALPIAVGAGVINDLTKYAAEVAGLPYVSVATAASMDGYAASGAALLDGGFKRTLACTPPVAILADLDIIANAPPRMASWGYGDLAGKVIAGADWILADAAGEDAIGHESFALVQDNIKGWLSAADAIAAHERAGLRGLVNGLLISGFAMQAHGNSRPASGSEHQISHVWEMQRLMVNGEPAAHGACVGVASVAMLALYEWFLAQDVPGAVAGRQWPAGFDRMRIDAEVECAFPEHSLIESARTEMAAKIQGATRRGARLSAIASAWPAVRARLEATLVPSITMERGLRACGAAAHPRDLDVPLDKLAADYRRARLIRRRYTLLDCLEDLGWLDMAIDSLFARDGFWARRARRSNAVTVND
jgi:glycerol-1-phosphate dehydrogenase [NAD(P)+]